jgi:hypothetical protein
MLTFACPACAQLFRVNAESPGTAVQCPRCGKACRIKANPAAASGTLPSASAGPARAPGETAYLPPPKESPPADSGETLPYIGNLPSIPPAPEAETGSGTASLAPSSPGWEGQETRSLGDVSSAGSITLGEGEDAAARRADAEGQLPRRIGRFLIRRCLGEGAFGRVYQAFDPQLDRLVRNWIDWSP